MKTKFLKYVWFVLILGLFCATMILVRSKSTVAMKNHLYRQWVEHFVVQKDDQSYIKTTNDKDKDVVLSEAQSYGMLITVQAAQNKEASQKDFDRLYTYYLNHRLEGTQLMSWRQEVTDNGETVEDHNATDGDLYIAYSLIEAAKQWSNKAEEYETQAKAILNDILSYNYNQETGVLTVGNWANQDSDYYHLMRTSDTLPKQFQAFYELTKNKEWLNIKSKMLDQLETISSQAKDGLLPDFIWVDESGTRVVDANTIESAYDGDYSYNACRLPYNLSQSDDAKSQKIVKRMLDFFMTQKAIYAGYNLSGETLNTRQSASFLAPISYAANQESGYLKLVQQNKAIFMYGLPVNNYYDSAMTTLIALEIF